MIVITLSSTKVLKSTYSLQPLNHDFFSAIWQSSDVEDIQENRSIRNMQFLADSGAILGSSLDASESLKKLTESAVPLISDWCAIDLYSKGRYKNMALYHHDPLLLEKAIRMREDYPLEIQNGWIRKALTSKEAQLVESVDENLLQKVSVDNTHYQKLKEIGISSLMVIPILNKEGIALGTITFYNNGNRHAFNNDDLKLGKELSLRAQAALEHARLWRDRDRTARDLEVQYNVAKSILDAHLLDFDQGIERIMKTLAQTMGWEYVNLWMPKKNKLSLYLTWQQDNSHNQFMEECMKYHFQIGEGFPGEVWKSVHPITLNDLSEQKQLLRYAEIEKENFQTAVAFPILSETGGHVLGVIEMFSSQLIDLDNKLIEALSAVGAQIGQYLIRLEIEREVERERSFTRSIMETTTSVIIVTNREGKIVSFNPAAERITGRKLSQVLGHDFIDELVPEEERERIRHMFLDLKEGNYPHEEEHGIIGDGENKIIAWSYTGTERDNQVEYLVATGLDITERKRAESDLAHMALHDALTGLPNRNLFLDRLHQSLERARRDENQVAVFFLDLDRFKIINDSLGHQAGDHLLIELSQRLKDFLRPADTIARFGGDEFTMLRENTDEQEAKEIAKELTAIFKQPFTIMGEKHFVTSSIGISLSKGKDEAEDLIRDADAAMYQAKEKGKNRYQVFSSSLRTQVVERLEVEHALREAIQNDELTLLYQPVLDINKNKMAGVEALIRWKRPDRDQYVSPAEFIPLAEESSLILEVGDFVIEKTCAQLKDWGALPYPQTRTMKVAINLSARQFGDQFLLEKIKNILKDSRIDPHQLCVEVTENAVMEDLGAAVILLEKIKELGVMIAIDDFGIGYSSLTYLRQMPADILKLDRSFIADLKEENDESAAMVKAVVELAHALKMKTTAEGVETPEQLELLKRLGCDYAQGYYLSPPCEADSALKKAVQYGDVSLSEEELEN